MKNKSWKLNTFLTILAIITPFIYPFIFDSKKNLSYEIVYKTKLTENNISIDKLKITINGEEIKNLYMYGIKISNIGSIPILNTEFEKPLRIFFSKNTKIYSVKEKQIKPKNLSLILKTEQNQIIINPMLLNPNDMFELNIYSSSDKYPEINARIAGISKITTEDPESKVFFKKIFIYILNFFLVIFAGKIYFKGLIKFEYKKRKFELFLTLLLYATLWFTAIFEATTYLDKNYSIVYALLMLILFIIGIILEKIEFEYYNKKLKIKFGWYLIDFKIVKKET